MTDKNKLLLEEAVAQFISHFNNTFLINNEECISCLQSLEKNIVFPDDYQDMYDYMYQKYTNNNITTLKIICGEYGLSKTGNKEELVKKIITKKLIN